MLIKINRPDCLKKYPVFPTRSYDYLKDEEKAFYPVVFKYYILTLSSKTFKGRIKQLGIELKNMTRELGYDTLVFLGDTEQPWLRQEHEYKPAKEAQQYLIGNKIGKRFNGALQVDKSELEVFIRHLSWLTRCNAALPIFHFSDLGQNIIGSICQYGNLHISTLNETTETLLKEAIINSNFKYLLDNTCSDQFGKTSAIAGRQIVV